MCLQLLDCDNTEILYTSCHDSHGPNLYLPNAFWKTFSCLGCPNMPFPTTRICMPRAQRRNDSTRSQKCCLYRRLTVSLCIPVQLEPLVVPGLNLICCFWNRQSSIKSPGIKWSYEGSRKTVTSTEAIQLLPVRWGRSYNHDRQNVMGVGSFLGSGSVLVCFTFIDRF